MGVFEPEFQLCAIAYALLPPMPGKAMTVMSDNHPAIRLYQWLRFRGISLTTPTANESRQTWYLDLK
ncbi:hypothetical protein [Dickeya solani]|uniref:N-acetyltransferase domain-containing protein n=1 Tax=Dickeya solani TaxID=1089444 RepID=A0AAX4F173_9GAMM|nr:hypothetical protein [Dickeya solani]MCA6999998.1 hypothetical protein [Dickeya solani]MCZ0821397.1 hypothetical protein [Dickeya solani]MDV6995383.1 hypothetical protein [Dickeya solani]MDV7005005.1 hypothetical protein [Dickeya solani]MDV7040018.1 hypothetical protein [Dickeya solani]